MTDTEAKPGKAEKTPEQKAKTYATRSVAKALSKLGEGTPEELKARWNDNMTNYMIEARKVIRALGKAGVTLQVDEERAAKANRGGAGKRGKKGGTESSAANADD